MSFQEIDSGTLRRRRPVLGRHLAIAVYPTPPRPLPILRCSTGYSAVANEVNALDPLPTSRETAAATELCEHLAEAEIRFSSTKKSCDFQ